MKKGKMVIMMTAIAIIFLTAILMATAYDDKKMKEVSGPDDVKISDLVYREEIKVPNEVETIQKNYEVALKEANHITVEKVIRTTTEDNEAKSKTVYDTYFVSDVDFEKNTDHTEDFTEAVSAAEYDEELITPVTFMDAYGFDYQGLSANGVYETLLGMEGFDDDLSNATFDRETNKVTGQNLFILKKDKNVISKLLPEYESKDIIEKQAYFQTLERNGMVIPDYLAAVVRYREGDTIIERNIYLQISVNDREVAG